MKEKVDREYFAYRKLLLSSLILLILIGAAGNNVLAGFLDGYVFDTIYLPPQADSTSSDTPELITEDVHPKLDSALGRVAAEARVSIKDAIALAEIKSLKISDSRVQVEIVTHANGVENAIDAVIEAGGEVTGVGFYDTLIQAWLPVSVLETVAAHDDIYVIRRPTKGFTTGGNSETEALDLMNALAWHEEGIKGAGVKIGVIDFGFEDYMKLRGTELPPFVTVKNFVDGEDDSQVDGYDKHGTACAEIIYDIAPEASLYLAKIDTLVDLWQAVDWLKDTHKVDIISTSFGYFNVSPGDGTGILADLVRDARNAGILWVKSAGNYREQHWGGPFADPEGDNIHNFNGAQNINYFITGIGSGLDIPAGLEFTVLVRWDDWTNVNQDYDLYAYRWNGSRWVEIPPEYYVGGKNRQNGEGFPFPTEKLTVKTFGDPAPYGFIIKRVNSTRNVNFEVFVPKFYILDEIVHARSLGNLADAPDAMTVAALDVVLPCPQEYYSSEGPTNGPGGTATGGFIKPDISGFANVSCGCYSDPFGGTSAATPHVAGAAALVLSAYPEFTPDELQSFLEERAIDMGATGMDTQFGHGRLFLDEPPPAHEMTWTPAGLEGQYINDLAIDPASSMTMYAAVKEDHLAKTTDGGTSWEYLDNSPTDRGAVAIDPQNTSTIYAGFPWKARTNVIYSLNKSVDGGLSWTYTGEMFGKMGYHEVGVSDILVHADNNDIILAAVSGYGIDGGGVYRSVDGGDTWENTRQFWANALTIDPSAHNVIYFGGQQYGYVFRSTDYGNSWNNISPDVPPGEWVMEIRDIDVDMDGEVYAATDEGMWKWNTQNWEKLTGIPTEDMTAVTIHRSARPGDVYIGTGEDGVFVSEDGGSTWASMNEGLGNLSITKLSISEGSPEILYAGTDYGGVWSRIIKETNNNDLIVDFGAANGIWVRYDDGTWVQLHGFSPELMIVGDVDGNGNDLIVDFGTAFGIWVRYDDGTWVQLHGFSPELMIVGDVDGNGNDDLIVDFGTAFGIWVRYDDGIWVQLHGFSPDLMIVGDVDGNGNDDLIVDFGTAFGIWVRYDDGIWVQLHGFSPDLMVVGDVDGNAYDDVIVDFGANYGIWVKYDDGNWQQLHGLSPDLMVVGDVDGNAYDDVIVDFGANYGIWVKYDDGNWQQLHGLSPDLMVVGDVDGNAYDDVIVDFGANYGIWVRYDDGNWQQLHGLICENIAVGDVDGN